MKPAPIITPTQAKVIEGLDLGLRTQIAQLYQVLCSDPTTTVRFERGLERAISVYEQTVAIVLDEGGRGKV